MTSSSSYEEDDEVVMKIPHEFMDHPLGFVVDAGGSVAKVLYRSKKDYKDGKLLKPSDFGRVRLRYFKMADVGQITGYLRENCDSMFVGTGSGYEDITWCMTGVTTQHFKAKLDAEFQIKTKLCSEMLGLQEAIKMSDDLKIGFYDLDMEAFDLSIKMVRDLAGALSKGIIHEPLVEDDSKKKNDADVNGDAKNVSDCEKKACDGGKTPCNDESKCNNDEENLDEGKKSAANENDDDKTTANSKTSDKASSVSPPGFTFKGPVIELLTEKNNKEWAEKYLKPTSDKMVTPSVLMLYGSAAGVLLVNDDYTMKGIDFTAAAGKTLCGLVEEMLGEKDFDKFIEMATRGNLDNVTILLSDVRNHEHLEVDWYGFFPDDYPVFELGKLTSSNAKGKGTYSREDLAAGILNFQASNISKLMYHNCLIQKLDHAYFCGSLMRYEIVRKMITKNFLNDTFWRSLDGGSLIKPAFIRQPGFLLTLGLWTANVQLAKKARENKKN
ncbi:hypothetical protein HELRODRAFT_193940 [Helobdella robusta]|uniref:Uncharacterized protein n=1 Tax=Helobdella robusta TaxID=6412 RepID=T1FVI0_HELRO|nr:hypothetical protein HELRODRAFT_193940 [Helobdella robusta]ESN93735.1 hypothetical protein HELRODRAFT_193940 [Helobdella robusta]